MTYQHALRYMTTPTDATEHVTLPIEQLIPPVTKGDAAPLLLCFSGDKQGHAAASILRSVLCKANVRHLHWMHDPTLPPKDRFLMDGKPLLPPLLAEQAEALRRTELEHGRTHEPPASLTPEERCCAILSRCAMLADCKIILLEIDATDTLLRTFAALFPRLDAITVLSETGDASHEIIRRETREVISLACGQDMFRRISDACAQSGSRLTLVAGANCQRTDQTLGSQILHYRSLTDCRIPCGSETAARAGFLTLQVLLTLQRYGISLSPDAVRAGMRDAELSHSCCLLSIRPLLLADTIRHPQELEVSLRDVRELAHALPSPRHVWWDPDLPRDRLNTDLFDVVHTATDPLMPDENATTLILGSPDFIRQVLSTGKKRRL